MSFGGTRAHQLDGVNVAPQGQDYVGQVRLLVLAKAVDPNQGVSVLLRVHDGQLWGAFDVARQHYYNNQMHTPTLLSCCTLLIVTHCSFDYDAAHTLKCSTIDDTWDLAENLNYLWNILQLHFIDRYFFLISCPLVFLSHLVLLATLWKYRLYRHSPLDVIFALIISQLCLNMSLFANAIYDSVHSSYDAMPGSFPAFCYSVGVANAFFSLTQTFYLIYFLIHVILNVSKSIKENKWFTGKCRHVLPAVLSGAITGGICMLGWIGLSQLGICQMTSTRQNSAQIYFPILQLSFALAFVLVAIYTYKFFRTHMPESSALTRRKFQENMLITRFTIGMSIIQGLYAVAMFLLYLNCQSAHPRSLVLIFATVFNLTRIVEFFYLIGVMMLYKKIGNKIKKLFRSMFQHPDSLNESELNSRRPTHRQLFELIDIGLKEKMLDIYEEENQIDFLKVTQVMTMLVGIRIAYREYLTPHHSGKPLKHLYFQEEVTFRIDPKEVADYEQEALILPRLSLLDGKCTLYAPKIFQRLLLQDGVHEVGQSFDLLQNSEQLYQVAEERGGGGGRSGQFFFFSADNKYILKTIKKEEFQTLIEELPEFYRHFSTHPQTLICKIYGLFKMQHSEISRTYYILLMKNISGCRKFQIQRTYDLKGSTDDRRVLKESDTELPISVSTVYKDLDFMQLEHKLYLSQPMVKEFIAQLKVDTAFLKELNIIDYSLLLMKVEWVNPPVDPGFWNRLQRMPSSKGTLLYYHVSLIDVSQKWDLQKKGEQWWKKVLGKKDMSAQQPSIYQARFMNFIREVTTTGASISASQGENTPYQPLVETTPQRPLVEREVELALMQEQRSKSQSSKSSTKNLKTLSAQ